MNDRPTVDRLLAGLVGFQRAIALDRAYQLAGATCAACGLPAVRYVSLPMRFPSSDCKPYCTTCLPDVPDCDFHVDTIADLRSIVDLNEEGGLPTARVATGPVLYTVYCVPSSDTLLRSSEYVLCSDRLIARIATEPYIRPTADEVAVWSPYWSPANPPSQDFPNRKAVERLLKIAEGET